MPATGLEDQSHQRSSVHVRCIAISYNARNTGNRENKGNIKITPLQVLSTIATMYPWSDEVSGVPRKEAAMWETGIGTAKTSIQSVICSIRVYIEGVNLTYRLELRLSESPIDRERHHVRRRQTRTSRVPTVQLRVQGHRRRRQLRIKDPIRVLVQDCGRGRRDG